MNLHAALLDRYSAAKGYAVFFEVADGTGAAKHRSADAIAIGLWRSNGFRRIGFEVKASRSDWLRELRDPAKAEPVAQYCHEWWLLATAAAVAKVEEMPLGWGLMELVDTGLKIRRKPNCPTPIAMSEPFFASLVRAANKTDMHAKLIQETTWRVTREVSEKLDAQLREGAKARNQLSSAQTELNALRARLEAFERLTGLSIDDARFNRQFGAAVQAAVRFDADSLGVLKRNLVWAVENAEKERAHAFQLLEAIKSLEELPKPRTPAPQSSPPGIPSAP